MEGVKKKDRKKEDEVKMSEKVSDKKRKRSKIKKDGEIKRLNKKNRH